MSEPTAGAATVTEGGGPPIEAPSIGGKGPEFEGLDGKSYTTTPPPAGKPRQARRRPLPGAAPGESADPTRETPSIGAVPAAEEGKPQPPAPTPAEPTGLEALRRPGESDAEFYPRLHQEDRARIQRLQGERDGLSQRAEQALQRASAEIQRLNGQLEPLLRAHYQREQEAAQRAQQEVLARLPDPEAEPERYRTLLAEETLRRQLLWEEQQREQATTAQQQAVQRQQQEELEAHLADRDSAIQYEMQQAIAADPSLGEDLYNHLQLTAEQVRAYDPNASDEDVQQAVYLMHLSELAQARTRGESLGDYIRQQGQLIRRMAAAYSGAPGNGNGHHPQQPVAQQQPAPEPTQMASPTAARVAREASRSNAAAPISASGGPGRPPGAPGEGLLPTRAYQTEEEYVRAGLRNEFGENWIRDSLGKPVSGSGRRRG